MGSWLVAMLVLFAIVFHYSVSSGKTKFIINMDNSKIIGTTNN